MPLPDGSRGPERLRECDRGTDGAGNPLRASSFSRVGQSFVAQRRAFAFGAAGTRECARARRRTVTVPDVELHQDLRSAVGELCRRFPDSYWRDLDREEAYPAEFVHDANRGRLPGGADTRAVRRLGAGDHRGGDHPGGGQPLRRQRRRVPRADVHHGRRCCGTASEEQKREYLPQIANGELRLQAFGVTEPTTGTDTTQLQTMAVRDGDRYVVNGQKVWISRAEYSDLMLLIARTTPRDEVVEEDGRPVRLPRRSAQRGRQRRRRSARMRRDDEPRHHRGVLRQPRGAGREPHRRGGARLPLHASTR